jgi:predicted amidohydrolase
VAIVQFDASPEQVEKNLKTMERLAREAVKKGARWVVFHEGTTCDYTDRLDRFAEEVPSGPATRRMARLAKELRCYLSFGLSEKDGDRFYMTQVFVPVKATQKGSNGGAVRLPRNADCPPCTVPAPAPAVS